MFSIIIPLFNEAKNIDKLIKEINFNLNSEVWSIKGETYEKI